MKDMRCAFNGREELRKIVAEYRRIANNCEDAKNREDTNWLADRIEKAELELECEIYGEMNRQISALMRQIRVLEDKLAAKGGEE